VKVRLAVVFIVIVIFWKFRRDINKLNLFRNFHLFGDSSDRCWFLLFWYKQQRIRMRS